MPPPSKNDAGQPEKSQASNLLPTTSFATVYANNVGVTASFNDVRVYFSEAAPKDIVLQKEEPMQLQQPLFMPRTCVVCSPEFARTLRDSLNLAISQYERLFGNLRPQPEQQTLQQRLAKPK
jgi:hypothetical protein